MPSASTLQKLADIASDQWGLVTRQQATQAGVPKATFARLIGPVLERVASGVYRLRLAPVADHLELRAAYLQLDPETLAWDRKGGQGVVSHRSAAALYGLGHLPADVHEFTLPARRQVRRKDVRIHVAELDRSEWIALRGLLVTRPGRIAADLLRMDEDAEAVARVVTDALRDIQDYPRVFVDELSPLAFRLGFRRGAGESVLRWLLELGGDPRVASEALEMLGRRSADLPQSADRQRR